MTVAEDDLDGLEDFDELDGLGEVIESEFTEAVAALNAATITRRDLRCLKGLLREHPVVDQILAYYPVDDSADIALRAVVESWGIPVPDSARKAVRDSPRTPEGAFRPCRWEAGCDQPARPRAGLRGPWPRWCAFHTAERKRLQDNGLSKPREPYRQCCLDYQAAGNSGQCPGHEISRAVWRRKPPIRPDEIEMIAAAGLKPGWWRMERIVSPFSEGETMLAA